MDASIPTLITMWAGRADATRPALQTEGRTVSYAELAREMLSRGSAFLDAAGPVVVADPDPIELALTTFGVLAAGKSPLLVNARYPPATIDAITAASGGDNAAAYHPRAPLERPVDVPSDADGILLTTSGSEGLPKIVRRSRFADAYGVLSTTLRGWPIRRDSRLWAPVPVASGVIYALVLGALVSGATAVLDRFDATTAGTFVRESKIDGVYFVPTMIRLILRDASFRGEDFRDLKALLWAGEPMDTATQDEVIDAVGDILWTGYGSTEVLSCTSASPEDRHRYGASTSGRPTVMHDVRIVGRDGEPLPPEQEGEIETRGIDAYRGYLGGADRTPLQWHRTGDFGRLDKFGALHVDGRRSMVVNIGGNRVSPEEPAHALRQLPPVEHAVVVAVEDPVWGNRLHGFVVPRPGQLIDADAILASLRKVLPAAKVPRSLSVIDKLPIDASGKLSLTTLRGWAQQGVQ